VIVQLIKNTKKTIHRIIRQAEGVNVRKFDNKNFHTISVGMRGFVMRKRVSFLSLV